MGEPAVTDFHAFLAARLDEDEAAAREASEGPWSSVGYDADSWSLVAQLEGGREVISRSGSDDAAHIARHDPARVLREVAAKRAIIELADEASGWDMSVDLDRRVGARDIMEEPYVGDLILRQMAQAYNDHPDYNPEWNTTRRP